MIIKLTTLNSTAELRKKLADCTLVSMDIEGEAQTALEIGLAACNHLNFLDPKQHSYVSFIKQNEISCLTLQLREPTRNRCKNQERLRFGPEPDRIEDKSEGAIINYLRSFPSSYILVLYDSHSELKWLSQTCPNLLQTISAYVDVQRLVAAASNNRQPTLRSCLTALSIDEGTPTYKENRPHRAGNDAVYTLAILASLLSRPANTPPLNITRNPKRPRLFYGRPYPAKAYPFTALIRTIDRTALPPELDSAGKIYNHFSAFNPITAGSGLTHKGSSNKEQLSWSWICFATKKDLDSFQASYNNAILRGGKRIIVESQYFPGVTLTAQERKAKQLEDGDKIREKRRRIRVMAEESEIDMHFSGLSLSDGQTEQEQ